MTSRLMGWGAGPGDLIYGRWVFVTRHQRGVPPRASGLGQTAVDGSSEDTEGYGLSRQESATEYKKRLRLTALRLPEDVVRKIVMSIPKRIKSVIDEKGWPIPMD